MQQRDVNPANRACLLVLLYSRFTASVYTSCEPSSYKTRNYQYRGFIAVNTVVSFAVRRQYAPRPPPYLSAAPPPRHLATPTRCTAVLSWERAPAADCVQLRWVGASHRRWLMCTEKMLGSDEKCRATKNWKIKRRETKISVQHMIPVSSIPWTATVGGRRQYVVWLYLSPSVRLSVHSSVRQAVVGQLTTISRFSPDVLPLRLVERFQWNLPLIFIIRSGITETVFKFNGKMKCTFLTDRHSSTYGRPFSRSIPIECVGRIWFVYCFYILLLFVASTCVTALRLCATNGKTKVGAVAGSWKAACYNLLQ